jgi:hypothetical protein
LRRAGALHGSEIQVQKGLLFVALVLVLLAQTKNLLEDFDVEALSLGFREDFLLPFIQRLDLFVDALNALDEGPNALAGDKLPYLSCVSFLFRREKRYGAKVSERLILRKSACAITVGTKLARRRVRLVRTAAGKAGAPHERSVWTDNRNRRWGDCARSRSSGSSLRSGAFDPRADGRFRSQLAGVPVAPWMRVVPKWPNLLSRPSKECNRANGYSLRLVLADFRCSGPLPTIPRFLNDTTVPGARLPSTVRRRPVPVST